VPHLPPELKGEIKDEIVYNIAIFIGIMLIGKLCSSLWKFRLYRKSLKKYAIPKKAKMKTKIVRPPINEDELIDTVRKPTHAYKVKSREEFKSMIALGQHYAVRRNYLGYPLYHHVLVSDLSEFEKGAVKILHYNGTAGIFFSSGSKVFGHVMEEVTNIDEALYYDIPDNLFHIRDPEYPSNPEKDGVLVRARERLGENRYGITYNNCEHFVRWALTGQPNCEQYTSSNMTDKVVGAMVDELPHIGIRMSMKLCKEVLYGLTLAIEQLVLQNSARLIQHTASASVASTLSTGAATFGWTAPVEAGFLAFRILDWKYHKSRGTMNTRDYNNAKDKAITGSVFSLVLTTIGAIMGQLLIPLPAIGAVLGSFWGGFFGRIVGIVLAGYGIAIKEKYNFDARYRRMRLWIYRRLNNFIDTWKHGLQSLSSTVLLFANARRTPNKKKTR